MRKKTLIEFIYSLPLNSNDRHDLFDKIREVRNKEVKIAIATTSIITCIAYAIIHAIIT
jgi:hypothetical protein